MTHDRQIGRARAHAEERRQRLEKILAEAISIGRAANRLMADTPGHRDAEAIGISAAQIRLHSRWALRHLEAAEGDRAAAPARSASSPAMT